jgi:hypothetical protein
MPTRFAITESGTAVLKDEVKSCLSRTREPKQGFNKLLLMGSIRLIYLLYLQRLLQGSL